MKDLLFSMMILLAAGLLVNCEESRNETNPPDGIWVEITQKSDTLLFDTPNNMLVLKRGTEIRNGYLLPKYYSGPYACELGNDSISLRWMASSSLAKSRYPFRLDAARRQLQIGNFFMEKVDKNAMLTFSKIH